MIAADAEIVDLDPQQWAWLSAAVLAGRRSRRWGYVLHAGGVVVSTEPELPTVPVGSPVIDAAALAEQVRSREQVERVVVIDRDRLAPVVEAAATFVEPDGALTRYRELVHDAYWTSEAVVTTPAPPDNSWRRLREATESIGDGVADFAVTGPGGKVRAGITFEVRDGVIRRISTIAAEWVDALIRREADMLLVLDEGEFAAAMASDDIIADLLRGAAPLAPPSLATSALTS